MHFSCCFYSISFSYIRLVSACRNVLCYNDTTDLKKLYKKSHIADDSTSVLLHLCDYMQSLVTFLGCVLHVFHTHIICIKKIINSAAFLNSYFQFIASFELHGKSQGIALPSNGHAGCTLQFSYGHWDVSFGSISLFLQMVL